MNAKRLILYVQKEIANEDYKTLTAIIDALDEQREEINHFIGYKDLELDELEEGNVDEY